MKSDFDIPPSSSPRKILIVDDHPIYREGLKAVLARLPQFVICAEAETAEAALELVRVENPDLVLVDLSLPDKTGLDLIGDIHALNPTLPVLAISMHEELLYAERVLSAGGRGYIMKQAGADAVIQAISNVFKGQISVSGKVSDWLLKDATLGRQKTSSSVKLTDREFSIMQFISQGKTCREIARELNLSVKTVNTHRGQIRRKFKLKSSAQLIQYAVRSMGVLS